MTYRPTFKYIRTEEELFKKFSKYAGFVTEGVYRYFDIYADDTAVLFQKMKAIWEEERKAMELTRTQKRALKVLKGAVLDKRDPVNPSEYGFSKKTFEALVLKDVAVLKRCFVESVGEYQEFYSFKPRRSN